MKWGLACGLPCGPPQSGLSVTISCDFHKKAIAYKVMTNPLKRPVKIKWKSSFGSIALGTGFGCWVEMWDRH